MRAIGQSHSQPDALPPAKSDLDIFIYCSEIPSTDQRRQAIARLGSDVQDLAIERQAGGHWGRADSLRWNGIITWLMYFTIRETRDDFEEILSGKYPDRIDGDFYPVGRCSMFKKMIPLYDPDGVITFFQERVRVYPARLARILLDYHIARLKDEEDLQRAVFRKDVLFYHFALEIAIDHFLQGLFACNQEYFPSRKRSLAYIQNFTRKPANCGLRLLQIIEWGSREADLARSKQAWDELVLEFEAIAGN